MTVTDEYAPARRLKGLLTFPNPVNEYAARSTAGLVVLLTAVTLAVRSPWLLWILAVGFLLRLAAGPRFSPFGQLSVRVIAPRIGPAKLVPGPPKRFAQGIGSVLSVAAAVSYYAWTPTASWVLVALITVAATLESVFGLCLGCIIFGRLQAIGLIPVSVCEACSDIRLRQKVAA
ncbi:protein of unknown function [Nakamurella panacisegetis]|uniref:DUF4395 domain-containing protein n=1 Tax=Nakamurella panacisegetis TaxID=1090615 RepID=A0A1H0NIQ0_9ACTN|nr:DUF4395 domain-containing protein [Nakamurella panacisegetis]SDO92285.1 protein of unknown function [Nakamurella panacisegetis]